MYDFLGQFVVRPCFVFTCTITSLETSVYRLFDETEGVSDGQFGWFPGMDGRCVFFVGFNYLSSEVVHYLLVSVVLYFNEPLTL